MLLETIGGDSMDKCHICGEGIWEERWPERSSTAVKKNVCLFCFDRMRNGREYKPRIYKKSSFAVCDRCGEISEAVKLTSDGWLCESCL